MSIYTVTSSARAIDLPADDWLPCCGLQPSVFTWPRRKLVGVQCQRPGCENRIGVLGYDEQDARRRWEQYRHADTQEAANVPAR